jgi:hypothetical protein
MKKNVWLAGFLGGVVMFIWLFISNAVLPLKSSMIHKVVPNQLEVHQALKENITEPGTYSCPYLSHEEEAAMPDYRSQPIYSITYHGSTHGDPGSTGALLPIVLIFVVTTIAAWMLSVTSERSRSSYARRVLFVALIGAIVASYGDLLQLSFGPQPRDYLVFLAVNNLITWTLVGLVVAACVRGESVESRRRSEPSSTISTPAT